MTDLAIFLCAYRVSDCCRMTIWRFCFGGGRPDRFVCLGCRKLCLPVRES